MKKILLALAFFLAGALPSHAQYIPPQIQVPCSSIVVFPVISGAPITDFFLNLNCNVTSSTISGSLQPGMEVAITITQSVGGNTFAWPTNFTTASIPAVPTGAGSTVASTWQYCGFVGLGLACPSGNWQNTDVGPASGIPTFGSTIYASNFGVKGGGIKYCDAAWTNASSTVTINNTTGYVDQQFTPAMTGWLVFGSNADCNNFNIQTGTVVQVPLGTLTVSATGNSATISTTTTGACTSNAGGAVCQLYIFPQDDGPALQSAWNATITACGNAQGATLILPVTTLFSGQFILGASNNQCGGDNDMASGTGLLGVACQGPTGCVVVPSPTLNWSTVPAGNGGFFSKPSFNAQNGGLRYRDFTIDCGGQGSPTNGLAHQVLFVAGNSILDNVSVLRCGTQFAIGTSNSGGLAIFLNHVNLRGNGSSVGFELNAGQGTFITNSDIIWGTGGLVQFTCGGALGKCVSIGNHYELGNNGTTGMILVGASAANFVDFIGDHIDAANNVNQPYIEVSASAGGKVNVTNVEFINPVANNNIGLKVDSGGTATIEGSFFGLSSLTSIGINNAGTLFDLGGNTNTSVTPYTGAGALFGSPSITGTALTTGSIGLTSGWGTSTVATANGDSHTGRFTITGAAGAASPTITLTFPSVYYVAPQSCQLIETGANDFASLSNPVSAAASTTSVVFTLTGTPVAVTYQFDYRCGP